VQAHEAGVEAFGPFEHIHMDQRIAAVGAADEAALAGLLRGDERFDRAAGREDLLDLRHLAHLVNLPQVEIIGLQRAQRLLEV